MQQKSITLHRIVHILIYLFSMLTDICIYLYKINNVKLCFFQSLYTDIAQYLYMDATTKNNLFAQEFVIKVYENLNTPFILSVIRVLHPLIYLNSVN